MGLFRDLADLGHFGPPDRPISGSAQIEPLAGVHLLMPKSERKPTLSLLRGLSQLWIAVAVGDDLPVLARGLVGELSRRRWFSRGTVTLAGLRILETFRVTELHCRDCNHLVGCFVAQRGQARRLTRICSECGHLRSYHTTGGEPVVVGV